MSTASHGVQTIQLDERGFLKDPSEWNEQVAQVLADECEIGTLTEAHWHILRALRKFYAKYESPPFEGRLCMVRGVDEIAVYKAFGTCVNAWKIAGLPDPGEEARTYMSK